MRMCRGMLLRTGSQPCMSRAVVQGGLIMQSKSVAVAVVVTVDLYSTGAPALARRAQGQGSLVSVGDPERSSELRRVSSGV